MNNQGVPDILLAVDWGADVNAVTSAYVEAFNKSGAYIILSYEIRKPTASEIKWAEKVVDEVREVNGRFQTVKKMFDGTEVLKELFVMIPGNTQKMPDHIVKMRMEAEKARNKDLKDRMKNGE